MCDSLQAQYKPRPSKRLLIHFWGGICLNSFADASGISKLIIHTFSPYLGDVESATIAARMAVTFTALLIVTGYFLSTQLISVIDNSVFNREYKKWIIFSLPFIYFAAIFPLAMSLALFIDV